MHESEKWKWSHSVVSDSSDPMDFSLPGSSVHGILQAKVLEWGAIAFSVQVPQIGLIIILGSWHILIPGLCMLLFFIKLIYFLLKDNCSTEFCCFLSNLNMNQPQVYIHPLPFWIFLFYSHVCLFINSWGSRKQINKQNCSNKILMALECWLHLLNCFILLSQLFPHAVRWYQRSRKCTMAENFTFISSRENIDLIY